MASIKIEDLHVSYDKGKSFVIENLNLTIEDGEFCVFLGPSGCGKSTAIYSIAGLLEPMKGRILFGDEVMTSVSPEKKEKIFVSPQERNIAMVFQEYALYPNMTVRENMSFALKTKKVDKEMIAERVNYMSKMLSIEQLLDRKPAELSGGQRQRVALGRALVRDPQVFLLDEPLGNLDAKLREQVRYELKKIQEQLGVTTIYVTHDQTEAMTMADKIVLLKDGKIMQHGSTDDLYNHPNNKFVAGFIGTPQINMFSCLVSENKLVADGFELQLPQELRALMSPYNTKKVDLGIRPSDFEIAQHGEKGIPAVVDYIEPLGDAYIIYVRIGEKIVVIKYAGDMEPKEKNLKVKIKMDKIHLFDNATGKRIND